MEIVNATKQQIREARMGQGRKGKGKYAELFRSLEASPTKAVVVTVNGQTQSSLQNYAHEKAKELRKKVSTEKLDDKRVLIVLLQK